VNALTDEERLAVAVASLRLAGWHPDWIAYAQGEPPRYLPMKDRADHMESLVNVVEMHPTSYDFAHFPKDD
jgi:hypothetical protein